MEKQALPEVNTQEIEKRAGDAATKRATDILAIGRPFTRYDGEKMAAEFIGSGKSVDEFRQVILEKVGTAPLPTSDIGMSERDSKRFSFIRAMNAMANPRDHKAQQAAALEISDLVRRLDELKVPMQERLLSYQARIRELEKDLAERNEENRELLKLKIEMIRSQLEAERARSRVDFN